jgi:hypothetical protein
MLLLTLLDRPPPTHPPTDMRTPPSTPSIAAFAPSRTNQSHQSSNPPSSNPPLPPKNILLHQTAGRDQGGLRRHDRHPPHRRRGLCLPRRYQVLRGACVCACFVCLCVCALFVCMSFHSRWWHVVCLCLFICVALRGRPTGLTGRISSLHRACSLSLFLLLMHKMPTNSASLRITTRRLTHNSPSSPCPFSLLQQESWLNVGCGGGKCG